MARLLRLIVLSLIGAFALMAAVIALVIWLRVLPAANPSEAPADYANAANWVCLPGRADSCATNLDTTAIAANGATTKITPQREADPPVDCFYVYPTVSHARTKNAPLAMAPEVDEVARAQFARFSTVCRPYAPLYRQGTLQALMAAAMGVGKMGGDTDLAYGDVRDAWNTYLSRYNQGRGVVLIGHSQGSRMLKRLLQEEIEGKPGQAHLVSAMLLGNAVRVPAGQDTGGDFKTLKLCRAPEQTGCVLAYSSFRASSPPPKDSRYGNDPGNGMVLACTNPAALGGGKAVLDNYFPVRDIKAHPYTDTPIQIDTPFVTLPGLISGQCVHDDHGTYLSISLNGQPGDHRLNELQGDVVVFGKLRPEWGLHIIDVNLAQGDLINLVKSESTAFAAATPPK